MMASQLDIEVLAAIAPADGGYDQRGTCAHRGTCAL